MSVMQEEVRIGDQGLAKLLPVKEERQGEEKELPPAI
jgi:hypothetical protein